MPEPCWYYYKVNTNERSDVKDRMTHKRRILEKEGLEDIKRQFNNGVPLKKLNTDKVIKDNNFLKVKSRQGVADYIERKCNNGRLIIAKYT